jgi:chromosome segregation ATPase
MTLIKQQVGSSSPCSLLQQATDISLGEISLKQGIEDFVRSLMVAESDHASYRSRSAKLADPASIAATHKTPVVQAASSIYVFSRSRYEGRLKELYQEERFLARKVGTESLKEQVQGLEAEIGRLQEEKCLLERDLDSTRESLRSAEDSIQRIVKERDRIREEVDGDIDCLRTELSVLKQNHDTTLLELEEREAQIVQLRDTLRLCREQASSEIANRQEFADKIKEQYERVLESKEYELRKLHAEKMQETEHKVQLARELNDAKSSLHRGDSALHTQLLDLRDECNRVAIQVDEKDSEITRLRRTIHDLEEDKNTELSESVAMTMEAKQRGMKELDLTRHELNEALAEKSRAITQKVQIECELGKTKSELTKTVYELQHAMRDRDTLKDDLESTKRMMNAELEEIRSRCELSDAALQTKGSEIERLKENLAALENQNSELRSTSAELQHAVEKKEKMLQSKEALLQDSLHSLQRLTTEGEERVKSLAKMKDDHESLLRDKEAELQQAHRELASTSELKVLRERTKDLAIKKLENDLLTRTKALEQAIRRNSELVSDHKNAMDVKEAELEKSLMSAQEARANVEKYQREMKNLRESIERDLNAKDACIQDLQSSLGACKSKLEATTIASLELREELGRLKHSQEAELVDTRTQLEKCSSDLQLSSHAMSELKNEHTRVMSAKQIELGQLIEAAHVKDAAISKLKEAMAMKDVEILTLTKQVTSKEGGIGAVESNLLKLTVSIGKLCVEKECREFFERAGGVGALADVIECHPVDSEVCKQARKAMARLMAD